MKAKRVRWVCPGGHAFVLAPTRLGAEDIRRFCWPCSEAAGSLVRRSAPSLERQRASKRAKTLAKERRVRASARRRKTARQELSAAQKARREAARYEAAGDLRPEVARLWGIARELSSRDDLPAQPPALTQRMRSDGHMSGRAYEEHRMVVSVGESADVAAALGTVAHEVAHLALPAEEHHGPAFWRFLAQLVRRAYDCDVDYGGQTTKYGRQMRVEQAIRIKRRAEGK